MSIWYEFVGSLTFATAEEATAALAKLRGDEPKQDTVFWIPPAWRAQKKDLVLDDRTITFAGKGWGGRRAVLPRA
jgi:hypothetical protein